MVNIFKFKSNKPSYTLTYVIQITFCKSFVRVAFKGTQRKEGVGLESVLVLERDTKTHSTMRIRYSAEKFLNHIMCCWLFGPLNIIHIPILCGSVENHDTFF